MQSFKERLPSRNLLLSSQNATPNRKSMESNINIPTPLLKPRQSPLLIKLI